MSAAYWKRLLVATLWFTLTGTCAEPISINTTLGMIMGIKEQVPNGTINVYKFLQIPFAKPPIRNMRFMKPEPFGKWNGTLNATKLGPGCIQPPDPYKLFSYNGFSEDCLQLNIYVPNNLTAGIKRSVMVWIHGGAYIYGSGTLYNGTMLAARGDVIVVTINYRLNIFGFFSFNDTVARGNFGLWDQIMALQWIHDNIADYTGDPDSVTIFGESAGGFSVSLLSLIPRLKGLFTRVISESGVSDSFFATTKYSTLSSIAFGDSLGCIFDPLTRNFKTVIYCVRSKPAETLIKAFNSTATLFESSVLIGIPIAPVVDGELFHDYPSALLSDKSSSEYNFFRSLDMIIGNCNMEGSLYLSTTPQVQEKYDFNLTTGIPNSFFCDKLAPSLADLYYRRSRKVSEAICKEYGVPNDIDEQSRQVLEMYTDMFFISPSFSSLAAHSSGNRETNTYQFVFTQKSPLPYGPPRPPWYKGVGHASEVVFLFGIEDLHYVNVKVTEEQFKLALLMKDYWTNFAKTGNPNSGNSPEWPNFDEQNKNFMQLNGVNLTSSSNYNSARVKFWLVTIPNIL